MLTANKLKGEFMSKNFEIINKEMCLPLENGKMSLKI